MLGKKKRQIVTFETLLEREARDRSAKKGDVKRGVITKIVQKAAACLC